MSQSAHDHAAHRAAVALGALESAQRRLDRFVEGQSAADVEHRRVPHLDVPNAVARRVDRQLVRDALECLRGLHHRQRHVESREVVLEIARVVDAHVLAQRVGVVARHRLLVLTSQLEQRFRANGSVEVTVQFGLRETTKEL